MNSLSAYSKSVLEKDTVEGRRAAVMRLQADVLARLRSATDPVDVFEEIVSELNEQGHNLFSWDRDPETGSQTWGPDYTDSHASGLVLEFEPPEDLEISWRG